MATSPHVGSPPSSPKCIVALEFGSWDSDKRHRLRTFVQGGTEMIATKPVQYAQVDQAAAATIKASHGEFYGFIVLSSTAGTITVKDGGSGGTTILAMTALTAGQIVHFGGCGILCKTNIYVSVGGTATLMALYV